MSVTRTGRQAEKTGRLQGALRRLRMGRILPVRVLQPLVHIGSLVPLALLLFDFLTDNLTANPIQALTLRTGKTALVLLVLSLACTPAASILDFKPAIKARRPLGLYAFMYAALHFLVFIWIDYGLNLQFILTDLVQKPYVIVGFSAFLLLLPLAITSTKGWQRRLGKGWRKLHKLVYYAGGLVVVHYIWVVKSDYREPLVWGAIIGLLLVLRIPRIRDGLCDLRRRRQAVLRRGAVSANR